MWYRHVTLMILTPDESVVYVSHLRFSSATDFKSVHPLRSDWHFQSQPSHQVFYGCPLIHYSGVIQTVQSVTQLKLKRMYIDTDSVLHM